VQLGLTRGHSPNRRLFDLQGRNWAATNNPEPLQSIWFNLGWFLICSVIFLNLTPL
jgi:hypothetical protein